MTSDEPAGAVATVLGWSAADSGIAVPFPPDKAFVFGSAGSLAPATVSPRSTQGCSIDNCDTALGVFGGASLVGTPPGTYTIGSLNFDLTSLGMGASHDIQNFSLPGLEGAVNAVGTVLPLQLNDARLVVLTQDPDGDGFVDGVDNCPSHFNPGQENVDEDGLGDVCDADRAPLVLALNGFANSVVGSGAGTKTFGEFPTAYLNPAGVPYVDSHTLELEFGTSTTAYEFTNQRLGIDFVSHQRAGEPDSGATSFGDVYFSVDKDTPYWARARYVAHSSSTGSVYLEVWLRDMTAGASLFYSEQLSLSTPHEWFGLMGSGGDFSNISNDVPVGTLIGGHDYRLRYRAFIVQESTMTLTPATATGSITVSFSHPVPASSLAVRLFLVLLIGLGGYQVARLRARPVLGA